MHIGNRIKETMVEQRITTIELERKMNLPKYSLSRVLNSKTLSINWLLRFSCALDHDFISYYLTKKYVPEDKFQEINKQNEALTEEIDQLSASNKELSSENENLHKKIEKLSQSNEDLWKVMKLLTTGPNDQHLPNKEVA